MNIAIIGGNGFIGYNTAIRLVSEGHNVKAISLCPIKEVVFPEKVSEFFANIADLTKEQLVTLLKDNDVVVFAAGADDRAIPKKPAYEFFYKANVILTEKVLIAAKDAGVKKVIICGSYFTCFNKIWKHHKLTEKHPYIRSRAEQIETALKTESSEFKVIVLELPYIVGVSPGREPLWKPLIKYIYGFNPVFYTKGGTNVVSVKTVANSILAAVNYSGKNSVFTIGDKNMTWTEFLNSMLNVNKKKKRVILLPVFLIKFFAYIVIIYHKFKGLEGGLNIVEYIKIQTSETFFDSTIAQNELGFETSDLNEAFESAVKSVVSKY